MNESVWAHFEVRVNGVTHKLTQSLPSGHHIGLLHPIDRLSYRPMPHIPQGYKLGQCAACHCAVMYNETSQSEGCTALIHNFRQDWLDSGVHIVMPPTDCRRSRKYDDVYDARIAVLELRSTDNLAMHFNTVTQSWTVTVS